jgi:putative transposase
MKPQREHATNNGQTYFITSETCERRTFFKNEAWAKLFLEFLYYYRGSAFLLHDFVIMPEHFHATITPASSLEKAVQLIKGGFSFRAKRELQYSFGIWQRGFSDHRIRDIRDYEIRNKYNQQNPVKRGLVADAAAYPYSSASGAFALDSLPQRLKPGLLEANNGTAEAVPLQNRREAVPLQNQALRSRAHPSGRGDN